MTTYPGIAFTPPVRALQAAKGSSESDPSNTGRWPVFDGLSVDEAGHITERDSFYLATVSSTGWPYVQHRGGRHGFVKVLDAETIGWIERTGNRQYIGTGNLTSEDRVAAIFVNYADRTRLKLYGHATYEPSPSERMLRVLGGHGIRADGAITIRVVATSWNCPKYITPRYTADEVRALTSPLVERIAELERQADGAPPAVDKRTVTET